MSNPFSVKRSSGSAVVAEPSIPNAPVLIGGLKISTSNVITESSFVGASLSKYTTTLPEFLELEISSASEGWKYFKDFDWVSASFTSGESDNVISYKINQDKPSVRNLTWYIYSIDNSQFPTTSDNQSVLGTYDSMYISVVFFGHKNIL